MPILVSKLKAHSNKKKTIPKIGEEKPSSLDAAQPKTVPESFIDKIAVLAHLPPNRQADVFQAFHETSGDSAVFMNAKGTSPSKGIHRKRIVLNSVIDLRKRPHFEIHLDLQLKRALSIRVEFVSVDLGPAGMNELDIALSEIVEDGWQFLLTIGTVTRLDVTLDFPDLTMEAFHVLTPQILSMRSWSREGELETVVFGKRKGNQTIIYDRGKKRKAQKKSAAGKQGVRVERRLRSQIACKELSDLANPFAGLSMISGLPPMPPKQMQEGSGPDRQWMIFQDSVQVRGVTQALALVPDDRRKLYRQHIAAHPAPWWQPEEMWKKWPKALALLWVQ